jgi:hypothetical protein
MQLRFPEAALWAGKSTKVLFIAVLLPPKGKPLKRQLCESIAWQVSVSVRFALGSPTILTRSGFEQKFDVPAVIKKL